MPCFTRPGKASGQQASLLCYLGSYWLKYVKRWSTKYINDNFNFWFFPCKLSVGYTEKSSGKGIHAHGDLPLSGTWVRRSSFGKTFPSSSICILQTITSSNLKKRQCLVLLEFRKISLSMWSLLARLTCWPGSPSPKDLSPQRKVCD